jgi:hypothetical protein
VVVSDGYIPFAAIIPSEDDPPLLVDPDAPETFQPPVQSFQSVSGWYRQVLDGSRLVQHPQLSPCSMLDITWEFTGALPFVDTFRLGVAKTFDHMGDLPRTLITSSVISPGVIILFSGEHVLPIPTGEGKTNSG